MIKIRTKVVLSFVYKYGVIVHSGGRVANYYYKNFIKSKVDL